MTLEEFKEYKNRPKCFYTKEEIQEILNDISQKVVVDTLPTEGLENYLYLVPSIVNPGTYEQYTWKNNTWEHLGNVDEALYTDYVTNPELDNTIERVSLVVSAALNDLNDRKQDTLVSGQNIKSINGQSVLGEGNLELGELFVVTMTRHNSVYTADKSVSEIYAASYTNGKPVIAVMRDINNPVLILTDCDPDGDSYVFSSIESNVVTTLRWQRTDEYTYELETIALQSHLVSGTNIKTVNNESLLGGGNVDIVGKSAYQSYVDTTTDSPVKTEAEWVASLKGEDGVSLGEVAIADNLTTDDGTKVLSAKQGYLLGQKVNDVDDVPTAGSEKFVKSGGVAEEINQVTEKIEEIYKEETTITQTVVFSSGGEVTFDTIELSQDGDYIEFDVKTSVQLNQPGRAFCGYNNQFSIGLMNYICGMRNISNGDIPGFSFNNSQHSFYSTSGNLINGGKIKVSYENGQIALYVKGVKVKETSSYAGNRPTIAINKMGSYTLDGTTYYWEGTINEFHYHHGNVDINKLSDLPNFNYNSNVTVTTVTEHDESGLIPNLTQRVETLELPISIVPVSSISFNVYVTNKENTTLRYSFYLNNYSRTINDESILCGDVWNQENIYRENTRIIQGNSNFIFAIDGTASGFENESSSRHAGPGHGCEVMNYVRFYADGVEINPTNLQETLKCSTFRFIQSSDVYAIDATLSQDTGNESNYPKVDENNNPVVAATHFIDMTLREDNDISIYNRLIIKRNGTVFAQLHGAMMQCYVPAFTSLLINDISDTLISVSAPSAGGSYINHQAIYGDDMVWHSRKANIAVSHGDGVTIRQEMTSEDPSRYGKMYIYTVPYNDRFKCYFMPAKTTLSSTSDYETFNNGDIIEVNVHRKIDIV